MIVPAQTHTATAHAVELTGAKPVFVDALPGTGTSTRTGVEAAVTSRTKAIAVVHFLGLPVDMDRINAIARPRGLFVLEDCALAVGSSIGGVHAGNFGDVGCFSFYPVKHMTTAEGGMVVTNDEAIAKALTRQKAFGVDRRVEERAIPGVYDVTMLGFNYRMNELGRRHRHRAGEATGRLSRDQEEQLRHSGKGPAGDCRELEVIGGETPGFRSSHYCLSVLLRGGLRPKRFDVISLLKAAGIGTSCYYPRPVPT